jgi:hypothetical protein
MVAKAMFIPSGLRGDLKRCTNLERLMFAIAPPAVGKGPYTRSLLWHYHKGARNYNVMT